MSSTLAERDEEPPRPVPDRAGAWALAARSLATAFAGNPFYDAILVGSSESSREPLLTGYFLASMHEGAAHGRVELTDPPELGAAVWHAPSPCPSAASHGKHAILAANLTTTGYRTYCAIGEYMASYVRSLDLPPNAWYLSILGVHPSQQGRGVGSALVRRTLQELDRNSSPSYLETFTASAVCVYERLGYRTLAETEEPTLGRRYWLMFRAASPD